MSTAGALKAVDLALSLLSIIEHTNRVALQLKAIIEQARAEGRELSESDFLAIEGETKAALDSLKAKLDAAS